MLTLADTTELMKSKDYKKRFVAEYLQTKIRYEKLHKILVKKKAGTLDFTMDLPMYDILTEQAHHMGMYLQCLEVRAEMEKIDIHKYMG